MARDERLEIVVAESQCALDALCRCQPRIGVTRARPQIVGDRTHDSKYRAIVRDARLGIGTPSGRQGLKRSRFLNSIVMASFTPLALLRLS
jgi:hypothetical protein